MIIRKIYSLTENINIIFYDYPQNLSRFRERPISNNVYLGA
ncbi:MAG: hypothetical protein H6Q18_1153 [Bacteroidetes bacterium]|nr:hypothetical protein [Bacteroidota bacterium]